VGSNPTLSAISEIIPSAILTPKTIQLLRIPVTILRMHAGARRIQ
jgi:hypothetical protein